MRPWQVAVVAINEGCRLFAEKLQQLIPTLFFCFVHSNCRCEIAQSCVAECYKNSDCPDNLSPSRVTAREIKFDTTLSCLETQTGCFLLSMVPGMHFFCFFPRLDSETFYARKATGSAVRFSEWILVLPERHAAQQSVSPPEPGSNCRPSDKNWSQKSDVPQNKIK